MWSYRIFNNKNNTQGTNTNTDMILTSITDASGMFSDWSGLTNLDMRMVDTSAVTTMSKMFYNCSKLTDVKIRWCDLSNVTDMSNMFYKCSKLKSLDFGDADFSKVESVTGMFAMCAALTDLKGFKNFGKGFTKESENVLTYALDFSSCTKLTHESLMNIINNLYDLNLTYDVANGGTLYTQKLKLLTNKSKLTDEEIAIATNKGWTVS